MKAFLIAVVVLLMSVGASADVVQHLPPSAGRLPTGQAAVGPDCSRVPWRPCFTTVQAGLDFVHAEAPAANNRFVYAFPATYTEDVLCDPAAGYTTVKGMGFKPKRGDFGAIGTTMITGVTDTVTRGITFDSTRCGLSNIAIINGPDQNIGTCGDFACTDIALRVTAEMASYHFDQVFIGTNLTTGKLDFAHLTEFIEAGVTTFIFIENSEIAATQLTGTADVDAATVFMDLADSISELVIINSNVGMADILSDMAGTALFQVEDGLLHLTRTHGNCDDIEANCFELNSVDAQVQLDGWITSGGLGGTPAGSLQGQFVEIVGVGSTAVFATSTEIGGVAMFLTNSVWGSVTPQWDGPCEDMHSIHINPVETADQFISVGDFVAFATQAEADDFLTSQAVLPSQLRVTVDVAPANGAGTQQWDITLRDASTSADSLACTISEAGQNCTDSDDVPRLVGNTKLTVSVESQNGTPDPANAAEMIISFCLNSFPR